MRCVQCETRPAAGRSRGRPSNRCIECLMAAQDLSEYWRSIDMPILWAPVRRRLLLSVPGRARRAA